MLIERIGAFVEGDRSDSFDLLARSAFRVQFGASRPLRRLCEAAELTPDTLGSWRDVPLIPTLAFKSVKLATAEAKEIFESSGTSGSAPSLHHHPYPELYRRVIDATFPAALLEGDRRPPMLSLVPERADAPRSSLAFMLDHARQRWAGEGSLCAVGPGGVRAQAARGFLAARQRDRRPPLILATTFALAQLLDSLARLKLSFRLPPGSRIFETGGSKGRQRELSRGELGAALGERLGLSSAAVVQEYGMTELTSHFYAAPGSSRFTVPPWVRFQVLEPATLGPAEDGTVGLLSIFDLANVGSALHVLTEDLAVARDGGFELRGRAAGAELRGCSLLSESLAAQA